MRRRLVPPSLVLAAALTAPGAVHAGFFSADPVFGPASAITVGDVDVARDGSGAVAFTTPDGGADHVFVSRVVEGRLQPLERLDAGLDVAGSQPAVAASDSGRLIVAWTSGGSVYAAVRPSSGEGWTGPQLLAAGGSDPSTDLSIHGKGYVSFTVGGDVRIARLDRRATTFTLLPDAADLDASRIAGQGAGRSRIAISADGTGVVVFGEVVGTSMRVIGRRVFNGRVSAAPQDLTLGDLDGRPGGAADLPEIDLEDDSSFGYAVFRQAFAGQRRAVVRRLVGSQFEAPFIAEGLPAGTPFEVVGSRLDLSGRGEAVITTATTGGAYTALIKDNQPTPPRPVPGAGGQSMVTGGIAENFDRVVAWIEGDAVRAQLFDDDPARRTEPLGGPASTLSQAAFGAVDPGAGFDVAVNRAGDALVAFVQGGPGDRRLMVGTYDREPGSFTGYTTSKWRRFAQPPLTWQPAFDLWGPLTYRVEIDGRPIVETTDTKVTVPVVVGDGIHTWRVVATDRRGQSAASRTRNLRVDATPPVLAVRTKRKGRVVSVTIKANDVIPPGARASGVGVVRIDWGDGITTTNPAGRKAAHRYARKGRKSIRVSATDRAGNATVYRKRVRVK
ncbi:MAG TPA: hypothetical protein VD931_02795 [Baekduia sp.]|nr:hypothetical protein [Baekduia sp.]